jgi:hypothetical protein
LTAIISWSSNSCVGFFPFFFSQDYRLSSGNALAAGERRRKRTGVYRCIAGRKSISQTIDSTDQPIARISLQLNNFRFPRCCHGRIEEL